MCTCLLIFSIVHINFWYYYVLVFAALVFRPVQIVGIEVHVPSAISTVLMFYKT